MSPALYRPAHFLCLVIIVGVIGLADASKLKQNWNRQGKLFAGTFVLLVGPLWLCEFLFGF